ncbi:hypothetical protein [Actinomadura formosensis]
MWRHDVLALGRAAERIAAERIKVKGAGAALDLILKHRMSPTRQWGQPL